MKKFAKCFFMITALLCSMFFFVACNNGDTEEQKQVELTETEVIAKAKK